MVVTVFRNRLRQEAQPEYLQWIARMRDIAQSMPGYVSHKTFTAEDGERVTIVEFASEETHRAWATHPQHIEAKKLGRDRFYIEYKIQVCALQRESAWRRDELLDNMASRAAGS
jgi:heme-degrading monooxygenase HmoA